MADVDMKERDAVSRNRTILGSIALLSLALPYACGEGSDGSIAPVDAAPDAPSPLAPQLIAPQSMSNVTQQRPMLRWAMPDGVTAPVLELCKDRACMTPLPILIEISRDGLSAAPQAALPPGWVYWRVRATAGGQAVSSATWQFCVGWSSASNPVDTSNGALLDVNGDGYADFIVGAPGSFHGIGAVYVYLGSATASATDWNGAAPAAYIELFGGGAGHFGSAVASAGDVNGDGYADFLVGPVGVGSTGSARLYLGSASPSAADWSGPGATRRIDLLGPVPGSAGFGTSVAGAGDVNGDGYADFVIGGGGSGGAHVYFGSAYPARPTGMPALPRGGSISPIPAWPMATAAPWPAPETSTATATPTSSSVR